MYKYKRIKFTFANFVMEKFIKINIVILLHRNFASIKFTSDLTASKMKTLTSSIKLRLENVINIKPYMIMSLLGEEFISVDEIPETDPFCKEVGVVVFNKVAGKLYKVEETFYIRFEDGRLFSVTLNED